MNITKETCKDLRTEMNRIIPDLETKFGLSIKIGNMRYSDSNVYFTLTCDAAPDGAAVSDKESIERAIFEKYALLKGGQPEWFGKEVNIDGTTYTIAGLKMSAKTNAFIIKNRAGKEYVANAHTIKQGFTVNYSALKNRASGRKRKPLPSTAVGPRHHTAAFATQILCTLQRTE